VKLTTEGSSGFDLLLGVLLRFYHCLWYLLLWRFGTHLHVQCICNKNRSTAPHWTQEVGGSRTTLFAWTTLGKISYIFEMQRHMHETFLCTKKYVLHSKFLFDWSIFYCIYINIQRNWLQFFLNLEIPFSSCCVICSAPSRFAVKLLH
jgi:hypothetical protein